MCSPTPHSTRRFLGRRESVSPKLHFDAFSRCCKSHRPVPPVSRPTKVVSDQLSKVHGGRSCLHVIAPPPMGKRSIVVNVSVCLFVCPRAYLRNYTSDLHCIFLCINSMAVAQSTAGGKELCYVFPVLWVTSYSLISQSCSTSPPD